MTACNNNDSNLQYRYTQTGHDICKKVRVKLQGRPCSAKSTKTCDINARLYTVLSGIEIYIRNMY